MLSAAAFVRELRDRGLTLSAHRDGILVRGPMSELWRHGALVELSRRRQEIIEYLRTRHPEAPAGRHATAPARRRQRRGGTRP